MDLHVEMRRQSEAHAHRCNQIYELQLALMKQLGIQAGRLNTQVDITAPDDSVLEKAHTILHKFRELPARQQAQMPALRNELGKVLTSTGQFSEAVSMFREASQVVEGNDEASAELFFNAYRALLEKRKTWDDALGALDRAVQLAPDRFRLFPLETYESERIVEVTATGVTFLCVTGNGQKTLVKALNEQESNRPAEEVFHEVDLLSKVRHPAILRPRTHGYADRTNRTRPWVELEYLKASTLAGYLKRKPPLAVHECVPLAIQLAEALSAVHQARVLHLNLCPSNVLVSQPRGKLQLMLTGFGMALRPGRMAPPRVHHLHSSLTASQIAESQDYAAPEQNVSDGKGLTPQTDVYGFARLCCYLLFKSPQPHCGGIKHPGLAGLLSECLDPQARCRPSSMDLVLHRLQKLRLRKPRSILVSVSPGVLPPRLVVEKATQTGAAFPLLTTGSVLGRVKGTPEGIDLTGLECEPNVECSPRHARIRKQADKWIIEDLGSQHGTFVNDVQVFPNEKRKLRTGDVIQVGTIFLRLELK